MATVKLALLKQQVRVDFTEDDAYLSHLLNAAEEYVANATHRTSDELLAMGVVDGSGSGSGSGSGAALPYTLQQAVLLIAAHWYNQREAVSGVQMAEVPYTLQALIKPYRKLVDDTAVNTNEA